MVIQSKFVDGKNAIYFDFIVYKNNILIYNSQPRTDVKDRWIPISLTCKYRFLSVLCFISTYIHALVDKMKMKMQDKW